MMKFFNWLRNDKRGQGMVEYALIIALVAVLLIGGLVALRGGIGDVFDNATDALATTGAIYILPPS